MARTYPEVVGVREYCAAIDSDCNHSAFVPIAKLRQPWRLLDGSTDDVQSLIDDGFFLVDPLGGLVEGLGTPAYVFAPHVAQRTAGGQFPDRFDRDRGRKYGFGGDRAVKWTLEQARERIPAAWRGWNHAS